MKPLDWLSFATGVLALGTLLRIAHWWSAAAVAVVLVMQVSGLLHRLPRPPGSGS